jgi:hypothetical protein
MGNTRAVAAEVVGLNNGCNNIWIVARKLESREKDQKKQRKRKELNLLTECLYKKSYKNSTYKPRRR